MLDVHRRYVATGCDVITTNTWGLPSALLGSGPSLWDSTRPVHWMDVARSGVRLARQAVGEAGRDGECAVAFSINGDVDSDEGEETVRLLARLFADEPADLILLETLSLVRPSLFSTVEALLATGLPVWVSFRRCRHGLCGVYGQHWGGPEGDAFGRAARRFEGMGVGAVLVNCIPPDHVEGMVSYLRDFTDLPLGVYPNLGYFTNAGWRFDPGVGGEEFAELARGWREEGAQIVGGCCGTGPEHIAAARARLEGTVPGHRRPQEEPGRANGARRAAAGPPPARWKDRRGRRLYPLPFPDLVCDPGVFVPGGGSYLAWKYLFREGTGAHQRCLDIGCGTGLLTVQLALNGAAHVHAIDIDERAVANTEANAFRNGVAERVSAAAVDLYPWVPEERYEVIVASLSQVPVDPYLQASSHRPVDYWGRSSFDQVITKLADALAPEGVAYLVQHSILSEERTLELLDDAGFAGEVVEFDLFRFESSSPKADADPPRRGAVRRPPHQPRRARRDGRVPDRGPPRPRTPAMSAAARRAAATSAPAWRAARRRARTRRGPTARRPICSPRIARSRAGSPASWTTAPEAAELHRLARRLVDEGIAPRLEAGERIRTALDRLGELGPVSEILVAAPREAAVAIGLDRVLLSRVQDGALIAEALYVRDDPEGARTMLARLREAPVALEYPLIEGELLRRRRALLVADDAGGRGPRGGRAHADVMGWRDYVTAPVVLEGRVIGFLHGDRTAPEATVRPLDRDALASFAQGLRAHRRARDPAPAPADPAPGDAPGRDLGRRPHQRALRPGRRPRRRPRRRRRSASPPGPARPTRSLRDLLTRRELDVLELMVKGDTNAGIARELVVSEGTVKFHVKNILRKLHAANRAEATSRYLRLTLRRGEVPGRRPAAAALSPFPARQALPRGRRGAPRRATILDEAPIGVEDPAAPRTAYAGSPTRCSPSAAWSWTAGPRPSCPAAPSAGPPRTSGCGARAPSCRPPTRSSTCTAATSRPDAT